PRPRPGARGGGPHRVPARGERRPLAVSGRVLRYTLWPVARGAGGRGDCQDQAAPRRRSDAPDRLEYLPALRARLGMKVERFSLRVDGRSWWACSTFPRRLRRPAWSPATAWARPRTATSTCS